MPQDVASGEQPRGAVRVVFVRALVVVVSGALIAASAAGGYVAAGKLDFQVSEPGDVSSAPFIVETDEFTIELPGAPVVRDEVVTDAELEIPVTTWNAARADGSGVVVLSADYTQALQLPGFSVDLMYDAIAQSAEANFDGTLVSSEGVAVDDDVARRIVLQGRGEYLFMYSVIHDGTLVKIAETSTSDTPPPEFEAVIASLVWKG
ncbi:MAG: hypothetical protein Q7V57_09705 [Actinomycetota bacterium]|nr:hypothetical protein [Actinomycetota bacterium]